MITDDIFTRIALYGHNCLSILRSMGKNVRKTEKTTEQIKTDVRELQPLLGLLTRPDEQELELGSGLQQALVQVFERLEQIENSISQVLANQGRQNERIMELEAPQNRANIHLEQIASVAALIPALMDRVDHIQADVQTLSADLFAEADSVLQ